MNHRHTRPVWADDNFFPGGVREAIEVMAFGPSDFIKIRKAASCSIRYKGFLFSYEPPTLREQEKKARRPARKHRPGDPLIPRPVTHWLGRAYQG